MTQVSVVIPTWNRRDQVRRLLDALAHQTHPMSEFEVVVVVDGSTDGTEEMLAKLETPYPLRVVRQANAGLPAARNAGIAAARGDFLVFIDDDIIPDPGLVAAHTRTMREGDGVASIGAIPTAVPDDADWFARYYAEELNGHFERLSSRSRPLEWTDCYGGNLGVPRAVVDRIGGFAGDVGRGEDIEFGYRLVEAGVSLVHTPEAVGVQDERKGRGALLRDFEAHGEAAVEIYRKHPAALPALVNGYRTLGRLSHRLRGALLATGVSPGGFGLLGTFAPGAERKRKFYRLAKSFAYWRGVRRGLADRDSWRSLIRGTPILMYHAFAAEGEPAGRYIVPIRRFKAQMALLKALGYRVLSLNDLVDHLRTHRLPPSRAVVITIDDGYEDNHRLAFPILRDYGFPATIFAVTGKVGGEGDWDRGSELTGRPLMEWDAIREMNAAGIEFGGHTRSHPRLTTLLPEQAREEIVGSMHDLERDLGVRVTHFAYPYGDCDEAVADIAREAGIHGSCGVRSGLNRAGVDVHRLNRTEVYGTDTLAVFAAKLRTGASDALGAKRRRPSGARNDATEAHDRWGVLARSLTP